MVSILWATLYSIFASIQKIIRCLWSDGSSSKTNNHEVDAGKCDS